MSTRPLIAPSILSADFANLAGDLARVEAAGADWIHLDVMDGHFVPNLTFGWPVIKALRAHSTLPFDAHLMIEEPDRFLEPCIQAGADWVTVHFETAVHIHRTLGAIRTLGARPGVSICPGTSPEVLEYILPHCDQVLIMSVNPGFGGQEFIAESLGKIRRIREMIGKREILISVDGGVTATNARALVEAGADVLVAGSAVFGAPDLSAAISGLRDSR